MTINHIFPSKTMNRKTGMTLLEVLLYIGVFSLIFSGYMAFTLEFSRTIVAVSSKADIARISMIVEEFVRFKLHHAESITSPAFQSSETELSLLTSGGVIAVISEKDIAQLLRWEPFYSPEHTSFSYKHCDSSSTESGAARCVRIEFQILTGRQEGKMSEASISIPLL